MTGGGSDSIVFGHRLRRFELATGDSAGEALSPHSQEWPRERLLASGGLNASAITVLSECRPGGERVPYSQCPVDDHFVLEVFRQKTSQPAPNAEASISESKGE